MGRRFIGVRVEGTYAEAWSVPLQYMDIVSESVNPDHGMIDVETAGYRSRRIRVPGAYSLGGDIELIGCPDDIGTAAYLVLGAETQTNSATIYRHLMTPSQTLIPFKCEIAPAVQDTGVYQARRCRGGMANSISFEAIAREALTATWGVTFQRDVMGAVSTVTPTFPTGIYKNPLIFHEGAVTFGGYGAEGAVANVEAFRCTIENDIDTDAYVLGSRYLPGIRTQGIVVSGDMDISFENWDMYKDFYDGAGGSGPAATVAENSLILTMTGAATGQAGVWANLRMIISVPAITFDTTEANFDRRDRIVQSLPWNAVYHPTATYVVRVEVVDNTDHTAI